MIPALLLATLALSPAPSGGGPVPAAPPQVAAPAAKAAPPDAKAATPDARAADAKGRVISDGPVAVTVKLTPDPSYIGDVVQLIVVAAYPKNVSVNLPIGLVFDPLHLVGIEESPAEATGEGLRKTFTIKLQHFDVGSAKTPGFPVTWVDESGEVHTLEVPSRTFSVDALLANEADPMRRDEDPPISIVYPNTTAETTIYAVFATLLAGLLAWVFGRRFFGGPKPVYVPPPIPAHTVALSALEELERGDLIAGERFTEYYVQLTEIAKGYLEGRFRIDALDRTTEELRTHLKANPESIAPLSAEEVISFLEQCDLVKFARWAPPAAEAEGALGEVRGLVQASAPDESRAAPPAEALDPDPGAANAAKDLDSAQEDTEQPAAAEPDAAGPVDDGEADEDAAGQEAPEAEAATKSDPTEEPQ